MPTAMSVKMGVDMDALLAVAREGAPRDRAALGEQHRASREMEGDRAGPYGAREKRLKTYMGLGLSTERGLDGHVRADDRGAKALLPGWASPQHHLGLVRTAQRPGEQGAAARALDEDGRLPDKGDETRASLRN